MHIQIFRKVSMITLISILLLAGTGILGYQSHSNKGFNERSFNTKVAKNAFSLGEAVNIKDLRGRKILEFVDDCNFFNFSKDIQKTISPNNISGVPEYCYLRDNMSSSNIFLWGDSHAQMLYYGLSQNLPKTNQLHLVARGACKPNLKVATEAGCTRANQFALREIGALRPAVVIVAQRDAWSKNEVEQLRNKLISLGVGQILFVGKSPEWKADLPKIVLRKYWINTPRRSLAFLDTDNYGLDQMAKEFVNVGPNTQFVDLNALFCNADGCLVYLGDDPKVGLTSMDSNHLSPIASDYLAKELLMPMIIQGIKGRSSSHSTI